MLTQILATIATVHRPVENPHGDLPVMDLGNQAEESSYAIAKWLMEAVDWFLKLFGLGSSQFLFTALYAVLVFLISIAVGYVVKWIILGVVDHLRRYVKGDLYVRLVDSRFFSKVCKIVPALVFLIFIQFTLFGKATLASWLTRITWIYVVFVLARSLNTLTTAVWLHVDARENKRKLPLNGLVQLIKGIIWILFAIVTLAILFNKSPGSLLAGLGAFAAVLMLVFKDSILGVVAGVQLSENDSLHVGDWIKVDGTDANGTVTEVSLTAVKVKNWDKTITTLPPYSLVSGSFTNYRPMQITDTRRIQRSYLVDCDSVLPVDEEMFEEFSKIPLLTDWLTKKKAQKDAGNVEDVNNSAGLVDGSLDTNLGIFRAYMKLYLLSLPFVKSDDPENSQCFVCTLAQTPSGIPLQIYCFTSTSSWLPYEAMQSVIFEHLAMMLSKFRLYAYENASGRDTIVNGILEAGKDPALFYGLPYPFYQKGGTPQAPAGAFPGMPGGNSAGNAQPQDVPVSTSSSVTAK